ncbi:MAG: AI-2E family transporter [Nevskia sp.]|nr:AI-2E family transporter [Nevskia sp.]
MTSTISQPPVPPRPSVLALLRENWVWFATGVALLLLFYLLGPILSPFVVSAIFAYLGDPLVDRLERLRLSRTAAVGVVFVVVSGLIFLALLLVVPLLQQQILLLVQNIPDWMMWVQGTGLPAIGVKLPRGVHLDAEGLRKVLTEHWDSASDIASIVLNRVSRSTPALLSFVADLLLIPIVTFYLLRDWDRIVLRLRELLPRRLQPAFGHFANETDGVLNALVRGQLLVMVALSLLYSVGLYLAGLKVALLIGLFAGLVSFIPYLGFFSALVIACVAMLVQTQAVFPLVWVLLVFGVGQVVESGILTPMLVGDRIGLHPVTVIFAILAGGQLFGFVGVLAALPAAAVLAVLVRHALKRWLRSPLYLGGLAPPATEADPPSPP